MKKILPSLALTLYCALCFILTPAQASAYIDPSTTTFIIQAGIGLAVAIAAGKEEIPRDESDNLEDL